MNLLDQIEKAAKQSNNIQFLKWHRSKKFPIVDADTILDVDPSVILKFVSAIREMEKTLDFYAHMQEHDPDSFDGYYYGLWVKGDNGGFAFDCLKRVKEILK